MHIHIVVVGIARHSDVVIGRLVVDDVGCIQLERHLLFCCIQVAEDADGCSNAVIGINEMVQDGSVSHSQVVGKVGCRGNVTVRLRFEDDGQMM